eukprot:CAMPEP_0181204726 /NCGR_PEP_ID=MMETSP1096-20121128/20091_1 /TAXON_ID=156174 ORGANISM="Chrysochromulina ericina, Strain CCMP281" /NCGR_SAMPLE_ID=MMETSP1096 /ASSEMBLY_ACC=CAM_ASM_000453 /LENGTH=131 /DNA_ID=CAMNT_0023295449 /DNA_START=948 /DNA_END=1341 /DNA_ORIENTATION=+
MLLNKTHELLLLRLCPPQSLALGTTVAHVAAKVGIGHMSFLQATLSLFCRHPLRLTVGRVLSHWALRLTLWDASERLPLGSACFRDAGAGAGAAAATAAALPCLVAREGLAGGAAGGGELSSLGNEVRVRL